VDVPFADQWALVPLLDRMYQGRLTIADLWAQHNEHRLLFPRLLMLGLARISGWNIRYELGANIALAGGIFGVLVAQVRSTARDAGMGWRWLVPVLALAVFSLNQAENWWGGWNIQIFLNVLAASASLLLLARPTRRWRDMLVAAGSAVVATYSYSNGLLAWPIGLALLAAQAEWSQGRREALRAATWLAAGGLTLASFFYQYIWTAQAPTLAELLVSPGRYLVYTLTYLGAPPTRGAVEYVFGALTGDTRAICNLGDSDLCMYVNNAAIAAGVVGVGLFAIAAAWLGRRLPRHALLPYGGLGLYALSTAIFTSLGRAGYGNHQALAQRYATTATLFWVALAVLLALCAHAAARGLARALSIALIGLFGVLVALGTLQGPDHFRLQYEFLAPARAELFALANDELLQRLYFDTKLLRRDVAILQRRHLSVFR
jgi:hypothetical protein